MNREESLSQRVLEIQRKVEAIGKVPGTRFNHIQGSFLNVFNNPDIWDYRERITRADYLERYLLQIELDSFYRVKQLYGELESTTSLNDELGGGPNRSAPEIYYYIDKTCLAGGEENA